MKTKIEDLIREHPLYSKLQIERPKSANELEPEVLLLHCEYCRDDRPFHPVRDPMKPNRTIPFPGSGGFEIPLPDLSFPKLEYYCITCNGLFQCFLEVNLKQGYIRKIGQNPPYNIAIPREIASDLAGDIALYKNAIVCLSQSYGIGACIYLRRLLESKINPLLEVLYETRKAEGGSAEELSKLQLRNSFLTKRFDSYQEPFLPPCRRPSTIRSPSCIHD